MLLQKRDKCTIKRPVSEKIEGETVWLEPQIIKSDVPCLLTVKGLANTVQSDSTASVVYSYLLFLDTKSGVTIEPNDIIEVTTALGQSYKARAGQSFKYPTTIQTQLEDVSVA